MIAGVSKNCISDSAGFDRRDFLLFERINGAEFAVCAFLG